MTKTWLSTDFTGDEVSVHDTVLPDCDRKNKIGSGVAIYVDSILKATMP